MYDKYFKQYRIIAGLISVFFLTACSGAFTPYRIEMRQGNYITAESAAKIETGMTKEQVRFHLGMPLLQDIFHNNRWDFLYSYSPGKFGRQRTTLQAITIYFDSEGLVSDVKIQNELPKDMPPILVVLEPKDDKKPAKPADTTEVKQEETTPDQAPQAEPAVQTEQTEQTVQPDQTVLSEPAQQADQAEVLATTENK